jgi:hypothetical protein
MPATILVLASNRPNRPLPQGYLLEPSNSYAIFSNPQELNVRCDTQHRLTCIAKRPEPPGRG